MTVLLRDEEAARDTASHTASVVTAVNYDYTLILILHSVGMIDIELAWPNRQRHK